MIFDTSIDYGLYCCVYIMNIIENWLNFHPSYSMGCTTPHTTCKNDLAIIGCDYDFHLCFSNYLDRVRSMCTAFAIVCNNLEIVLFKTGDS